MKIVTCFSNFEGACPKKVLLPGSALGKRSQELHKVVGSEHASTNFGDGIVGVEKSLDEPVESLLSHISA